MFYQETSPAAIYLPFMDHYWNAGSPFGRISSQRTCVERLNGLKLGDLNRDAKPDALFADGGDYFRQAYQPNCDVNGSAAG